MVGDFAVSQTPGYDILPEKLGGRGSSLEEAPASGEEKSGIPVAMNRRGVDFSQDKKLMESLRRDMREASPKDPWSRLNLAHALEAEGESFLAAGNFQASSLAHSEAAMLFRESSALVARKDKARLLLRQWVNARRAREDDGRSKQPDIKVLVQCIDEMLRGMSTHSQASQQA